MRTAPLLVALALALAACTLFPGASAPGIGPSGVEPSQLAGAWQMDHGRGPDGAMTVPAGARVTIEFNGDRVSGQACNIYGGTYELGEHGELRLSAMQMTEMACEEPMMSLEAAYHAALALVKTASVDDGRLTLGGEGVELIFSRIPEVPAADLVGTRWTLTTLFQGDVASSVLGDAWLQLQTDGGIHGATGCRPFDGSYAVDADRLQVTDLVVTDTACEQSLDAQDRLVLDVLHGGLRYEVNGRQLTLTDTGFVGGRGLGYLAPDR